MPRFWILATILLAICGVVALMGAYLPAAGCALVTIIAGIWRVIRVREIRRRRLDETFS